MLQLGHNVTDTPSKETFDVLAWVVCHFVGFVVDRPKNFWLSMQNSREMKDYITTSDLAFAVLLLEHHVMEWRSQILWNRETGGRKNNPFRRGSHLFYKGGIAGEEAKARFHGLNVYFHANFFDASFPKTKENLSRLRDRVKELVDARSVNVEASMVLQEGLVRKTSMKDLQGDVLHRVFYYMNS